MLRGRRWALVAAVAVLAGCSQATDGAPAPGPADSSAGSTPRASGAPPSSSAPADGATTAQFHDCSAVLQLTGLEVPKALAGKLSAQCGSVPVPLDYSRPDGTTIPITVLRIHDSDNAAATPLFVNPGGPGASAVEFALGLLTELPPTILRHYDLTAYDPRGVGLSHPITCLSGKQKDAYLAASPDVSTTTGFAAARALARRLAGACSAKVAGLRFYDTVDTARDLDTVRAALKLRRVNYLGFSYGTELGSVYAHLYPKRVGVAVLDGAVDPLDRGQQSAEGQLRGFEDAFDQFAAQCPASCRLPADPRGLAETIEQRAADRPIGTDDADRPLTFALAATGILYGLYSHTTWPALADALRAADSGDGTKLLKLADSYNRRTSGGTYENILDANTAVQCNDSPPGPSDTEIRTLAARWARDYRVFGRLFAISLFTCQQWQSHRTVPPKPTAATRTKVLVVGNLHDPATPYQGAKDLTRIMGNATLLSWDGTGHTSYLSGSSCVDGYVDAYLLRRAVPPAGASCPR